MKRNFIKKHLKALTIIGVLLSCTLVTGMLATTINRQEDAKDQYNTDDVLGVKELKTTVTHFFRAEDYPDFSRKKEKIFQAYYDSMKVPYYFYGYKSSKNDESKWTDIPLYDNNDIYNFYPIQGIIDSKLQHSNLTIDNNVFPIFNPKECVIDTSNYKTYNSDIPLAITNKTGVTHYTSSDYLNSINKYRVNTGIISSEQLFDNTNNSNCFSSVSEFNFRLNSEGRSYGESGRSEDTCFNIQVGQPTFIFIDDQLVLEMWANDEGMKGLINFAKDKQYSQIYTENNEPMAIVSELLITKGNMIGDSQISNINDVIQDSTISLKDLNLLDGKEHTLKIFTCNYVYQSFSRLNIDMNFQEDSDLNVNKIVDKSNLNNAFNVDNTFDISVENKLSNNSELQYTNFAGKYGAYSKGSTHRESYTSDGRLYITSLNNMSFGDSPSYLKLGSGEETITDITNYSDYFRFTAQVASGGSDIAKIGICLEDESGRRVFGWCNDYAYISYSNLLNKEKKLVNFKIDLKKLLSDPNSELYTTEDYKDFDVSKLKGFYLVASAYSDIIIGDIYFGHDTEETGVYDNTNNLDKYKVCTLLHNVGTCDLPQCLITTTFPELTNLKEYKYIKFKMTTNNEDTAAVLKSTKIYLGNKENYYNSFMQTKRASLSECIVDGSLVNNDGEISGMLDIDKLINVADNIQISWAYDPIKSDRVAKEKEGNGFDISKVISICLLNNDNDVKKVTEFEVVKDIESAVEAKEFPINDYVNRPNTCGINNLPCLIPNSCWLEYSVAPKYIQIDFTTSTSNNLSINDVLGKIGLYNTKYYPFDEATATFKFGDVIKETTFDKLNKASKYSVILDINKIFTVEEVSVNNTADLPFNMNNYGEMGLHFSDTSNSIASIDAIYTLSDMPEMNIRNGILYKTGETKESADVTGLTGIKNTEALDIGDYNNPSTELKDYTYDVNTSGLKSTEIYNNSTDISDTCSMDGKPCLIPAFRDTNLDYYAKYVLINFTTTSNPEESINYSSFNVTVPRESGHAGLSSDIGNFTVAKSFTKLQRDCKYSIVLDLNAFIDDAEDYNIYTKEDLKKFGLCISDTSGTIKQIDSIYALEELPNITPIASDTSTSISPISQIQGENIDSQDGHFQIKNGEYVHITNQLSPSTDYKVTENLTDIQKLLYDTKWTVTNTDGTEVSGEGTKTDDIKMASISTAIDTKAVFANVTFTNTLKTHQLVVKKETKVNTDKVFKFNIKFKFNNDADFRVYGNLAYDILDADGNMIQSTISNDGTFTLAQNQSAVFKGLPNTIEYQINEEVDKDFALFKVSISDTFDENTKIVNGKIEDADDYATFINAPINVSPVGPNDKVEVETPEGNVNISTETSTPKKETQTVDVLQDKPIIEQVLTGDDTRIALIVIVLIISGGLVIVLAKKKK